MENRFTLKDLIFVVLLFLVVGAILWMSFQFNYQEQRQTKLQERVESLGDIQKEQLRTLNSIRDTLKQVQIINSTGTAPAVEIAATTTTAMANEAGTAPHAGRIRRVNPDGSQYVYYPEPPELPRNAYNAADYAQGDWVIRNLGEEPKIITPFIEKDYYGQLVQLEVMEPLISINELTGDPEPFLAESYTVSPDGLTFRFTLRKDACFSDGTPVRADDVVFSINTVLNPEVDCAPMRSSIGKIKDVKKVDDLTVEVTMEEIYFRSLETVGGILILPKQVYKFTKGDEYNDRGGLLVGSGPLMLQAWDRGQQIVLVRNDKYWGRKYTFDKMVMKFIKNPQAALQAFQNGQLDIHAPDPDQWMKIAKDPKALEQMTTVKYIRVDSGYSYIGYNETHPMFKDKATRQALTMLIDRKAIIHTFMRDLAVEITSPFNPITEQNDPAIQPWPYDIEGAKKKLAEAGWKEGPDGILMRQGEKFEFNLSMGSGNPVGERIATYFKEQLGKVGILVHITPYEFSVYTERLDARDFDACMLGWSGGREEDPYQIWHSDNIAGKGSNFISFRNAESDKLIVQGRKTLDKKERMKIWHQWQALIHEEQPYTFLTVPMSRGFINKRFKNIQTFPTGLKVEGWYVPTADQKYH